MERTLQIDRTLAMLGLTFVKGLGPVWIRRLVQHFQGQIEQAWSAPQKELLAAFEGREYLIQAMSGLDWEKVKQEQKLAQEKKIVLIPYGHPDYPHELAYIYDPPALLYLQGNWLPQDNQGIAIVGTRHASPYGIRQAYRFAKELAERDITVISGLARGIDIAAHKGALAGHGRTIAILGSGLSEIYPPEHAREAQEIIQNGALISEYAIEEPPMAGHFPERNRIISGMALGVIVIEAGQKSGALITAHSALDQGREVFALPGEIERPETLGTHQLIQEGAKLVTSIDDVLEEILVFQDKVNPKIKEGEDPQAAMDAFVQALSPEQRQIWEILTQYPQPIDEIASKLPQWPPSHVSSTLLVMELQGIVNLLPGHRYARKLATA